MFLPMFDKDENGWIFLENLPEYNVIHLFWKIVSDFFFGNIEICCWDIFYHGFLKGVKVHMNQIWFNRC